MSPHVPKRRPDLDALRVFACYLLLLFHVGMVFNPAPFYHVRNGEVHPLFLIVCGFISLWHMPLFFLLAGWSAAASLRARGVRAFLRERRAKLLVPLVAGCVLFGPGIKFLELRSGLDLNHRGLFVSEDLQQSFRAVIPVELPLAAPFDESFAAFAPTYFTDLDRFTWSHLWFLAYLLSLSVVLLPVFARLLRVRAVWGHRSRVSVYLPILPLALVQLTLRERFPGPYNLYDDWASVAFFATFLLCGFLLAVDPRLEERVHEEWRRAAGVGLAATAVLLAAVLQWFDWTPAVLLGSAVAGWCFVVALLGFARDRVRSAGPRAGYLVESAFPVYLLHQPVIVLLGYGVVQLPLGIAAKFALLLAGSAAVTLALFHFAVRPFGPARALAGLKPLQQPGGWPAARSRSAEPALGGS